MNFTNKILFILVGSIIVIHTLIPHTHQYENLEYELCEKEHCGNNILCIIKLAFYNSPSTVLNNALLIRTDISKPFLKFERSSLFNQDLETIVTSLPNTISFAGQNIILAEKSICQSNSGLRSPPKKGTMNSEQ